ncbi:hypothetical protein MJO47_09235 [Desulfuromonas sp. KJ2020]|uniref:hypothetical protein n=1 Tax=Desulfuromonas sp. KJ2020 TaxID=2919173 RepID=UPI0020A7810C|nr:hypothetical protein [Desulfuromonas sp. KJ2020]MCP3177280.1 hypothetical protein [Desulfuromonas sp. KJ2020]
MASVAERNSIAVLVMVELVAGMFRRKASDTLAVQLDRIDAALEQCWPHWQVLSHREVERIYQTVQQFDETTFGGKEHNPALFTSMLIAMVESVGSKVKGCKADVIGQLHRAVMAVHRYYDRSLRRWSDYQLASQYLEAWEVQ